MRRTAAFALLLALTGCASFGNDAEPVAIAGSPPGPPAAPMPAPTPPYELTKQEKALDCKRLTGRMKVKIDLMRIQASRPRPSEAAAAAQQVAAPVFGGSTRSANLEADYRADRAQLDAFNTRLGELKCPKLDIDAELAKPVPAKPAPKAPAPKAAG